MASPTVEQVIENSTNTAGTSHTINLPTATAGHLLLIILDKGSTAATVNAHASLTELLDENSANGLYIAYRQMDGTEPASYTLTTSANTRTASFAYRISGHINPAAQAPQIGTTATGTSATPDPPASAAPGSTQDYLFIAFYGAAGEEADDDTWSDTPPTNYTPSPPRQKSCGTAGTNLGGLIAAAERQLNTGSAEDPGTFAKDVSVAWRAQTIMVSPTNPQSVTPSTATLTTATFAPTVTATANQLVTPTTAALTTATFAPTVTASDHQTVTPGAASLTTATFAPVVSVSDNQLVTPSTASLALSSFEPIISVSDHKLVTPDTASLATETFEPTVSVSDNQSVTPDSASLALTTFEPTVSTTAHVTVTPGTASLSLAAFAPAVTASDHKIVTPDNATLATTLFAPTVTVTVSGGLVVTPDPATLALTAFAPTVTGSAVAPPPTGTGMPRLRRTRGTVFIPEPVGVRPLPARLGLTTYAPTVVVSNTGRRDIEELLLAGVL